MQPLHFMRVRGRAPMNRDRFHGRVSSSRQMCAHPGCPQAGEFRAPLVSGGFDGPGAWRWLCLDHVREFNSRYNFFDGMTREEIEDAQTPLAGWARETRAFAQAGADSPPRWRDFHDPLDAISARFRGRMEEARSSLPAPIRAALKTMGLSEDASLGMVRKRYSELVRRYHPDRNGGDRSHERALQGVLDAWQTLKTSRHYVQESHQL